MAHDPSQTNYLTFTSDILQNGVETFTSTHEPLPYNFGVVTTQTPETDVIQSPIHFVLSIDTSSSMYDCMDMLKKTIKNILTYLYEVETTVYITIILFNTDITVVTKHSELNEETLEALLTEVDNIRSNGMTNMEQLFRELNKSHMESIKNIHLFLTDGEPTSGLQTTGGLCRILMNMDVSPADEDNTSHTEFEHHFLGFGTSHNQAVLDELVGITSGEYYFVDTMENAGLVYGEVLNNILYRAFEYITFTSDNIEFYNYKTNHWDNKHTITSLSSMRKVETHVRFAWECEPGDLCINITYTRNNYTDHTISSVTHVDTTHNIKDYDNTFPKHVSERNLEIAKYLYRQEVLETLYEINNYKPTYDERASVYGSTYHLGGASVSSPTARARSPSESHRDKLKTLFEKINEFVQKNALQDDPFMKQLTDDVYVAYKSFGVQRLRVYSVSRHISQGEQRAYNVSSSIESFDTRMNRRYVRMTGGRAAATGTRTATDRGSRASLNAQYLPRTPHSAFSTFPDSLMGPLASLPRTPSRNVDNPHESPGLDAMLYIPNNTQSDEEPMEPMELSPFTRYTVSQDPMSPYATPQQRKTMTRISRSVDL